MILAQGNIVLVAHRRLFHDDTQRFFVGSIDAYEYGIARATGYTWALEGSLNTYVKKPDLRTKLIAIAAGTTIVYQLPSGVDLEVLDIHYTAHKQLVLTDGNRFAMDLTDRPKH